MCDALCEAEPFASRCGRSCRGATRKPFRLTHAAPRVMAKSGEARGDQEGAVPKVTRDWVAELDQNGLDALLALAVYVRRAELLFTHTHFWFKYCVDGRRSEANRLNALHGSFIPYWTVWASLVFVAHEGFKKLRIDDERLNEIRRKVNLPTLKNFRDATFHFDPIYYNPRHDDLMKRSFVDTRYLHERQRELIYSALDHVKDNPHADVNPRQQAISIAGRGDAPV
jgi:hypothetical protein